MTDNDKKSASSKTGASDSADDTKRAGPSTMPQELDDTKQWDDVAGKPGFQKGDQGGYRGHYDETKFEETDAQHFPDTKDEAAVKAKSDGAGQSQPAKPTTKQADAAVDAERDRNREVTGTEKKSS